VRALFGFVWHGSARDFPVVHISPRLAANLTLPALLWAGNAVVGRLLRDQISPVTLNGLRWSLALLLLAPLAWRLLRHPGAVLGRWRYFGLVGFLGMGCYNALQYQALHTSSPLNVTLMVASMPVWMMAVGALFFGVRPQRRDMLGAALSTAGVLLVIARGDWRVLAELHFVPGDGYMVIALFVWAVYSWFLARPPASMQGAQRPVWTWAEALMAQLMFGASFALGMAGIEQFAAPAAILWSPGLVAALVFVAVGPSLIAYRCWSAGVAEGGPALAALASNLTPVFAAVLSAALLGLAPEWFHGVAFVLIVAGIGVSLKRPA
jgi:drug/metabolite transporter (DMT)-like permease